MACRCERFGWKWQHDLTALRTPSYLSCFSFSACVPVMQSGSDLLSGDRIFCLTEFQT